MYSVFAPPSAGFDGSHVKLAAFTPVLMGRDISARSSLDTGEVPCEYTAQDAGVTAAIYDLRCLFHRNRTATPAATRASTQKRKCIGILTGRQPYSQHPS